MEDTNDEQQKISVEKLVFGIILLVVGGLMLGSRMDLWEARDLWKLWPLFLVVLGLTGEYEALRKRKNDGGMILVAIGIWMLIGTNHWFGLSVGTAMPVGVVIIGLFLVIHAIVDKPEVKEINNEHK